MSAPEHPLNELMKAIREEGHDLCYNDLLVLYGKLTTTPSSHWREEGKPDPHGKGYEIERAKLVMGYLSDDELANGAFMNYDVRPALEDIIAGKRHSPIAWMTAVKDRIRWLSRRLENLRAHITPHLQNVDAAVAKLEAAAEAVGEGPHRVAILEVAAGIKAGTLVSAGLDKWKEPTPRRQAFEAIVCREAGPGAVERWPNEEGESYKNTRVDDYYTGWLWAHRDSTPVAEVARAFITKHRIHDEGVCEDRVYENAPELVEALGNIVGFYEYSRDKP